jgi:predicted Na+-dependent transporter
MHFSQSMCLPKTERWVTRVWEFVNEHAFLFGMVFAVSFAAAVPSLGRKSGPLAPEYTVKYGAIPLTFFFSGLSLRTADFLKAITRMIVLRCIAVNACRLTYCVVVADYKLNV